MLLGTLSLFASFCFALHCVLHLAGSELAAAFNALTSVSFALCFIFTLQLYSLQHSYCYYGFSVGWDRGTCLNVL
jgi:hypothetical protein